MLKCDGEEYAQANIFRTRGDSYWTNAGGRRMCLRCKENAFFILRGNDKERVISAKKYLGKSRLVKNPERLKDVEMNCDTCGADYRCQIAMHCLMGTPLFKKHLREIKERGREARKGLRYPKGYLG